MRLPSRLAIEEVLWITMDLRDEGNRAHWMSGITE